MASLRRSSICGGACGDKMGCYSFKTSDGEAGIMCGDLGEHCADCGTCADFLCDYPVGNGKTCDRQLCDDHANEVAPEIHYCDQHLKMWQEFRESGGVEKELKNVVPWKIK